MAPSKKKLYVVFKGKVPGIYDSWACCDYQVHRFGGSLFQSFEDTAEAQRAWEEFRARNYDTQHAPANDGHYYAYTRGDWPQNMNGQDCVRDFQLRRSFQAQQRRTPHRETIPLLNIRAPYVCRAFLCIAIILILAYVALVGK
ncbi:hypothetical protein PIB30_054879 [Stylosanthes scabra]|uniref:Ribonuclease H1 N-terminal domain-containing protein n=1 Tax=Stylosanthes scabra TaxID=79078 RepID=A0ABU6XJJ0_9FABA|nr:hypothetical protein [Stylosanthes scabra]